MSALPPVEDPAQQPPRESLGAALRAAREAAGLSVDEVSASTRIRSQVVRDLEADRLTSSGGAVYARGHVRALCHAAGADPAPVVALLDRATGTSPAAIGEAVPLPAPVARTGALAVPRSAPPERRGPQWAVAAAIASVVLVALFVVGAARDDEPETVRFVTAPTPVAVPSLVPTPPAPPLPAAPTGAELAVRVLDGTSWISVSSPTETVFEGLVRDGFTEVFTHPEQLRLVVGNAGAVSVTCAGTDSGPLGRAGAVLRLTCAPTGLDAA